ncbi:MAG: type VI secretion system ATPase TssH [Acidobacteria bacterium]|nr:type VI secretion system ATPase TssH [Acidobacteriota bacterium]
MIMNLRGLVTKLNPAARKALEGAAALCVSRTHYDVEIEHYLLAALDQTGGDFDRIAYQFGLDPARLNKELNSALDELTSGNARTPSLSPSLVKMLTEAWQLASLSYGAPAVRVGHAIIALAVTPELWRQVRESSREMGRIVPDTLRLQFEQLMAESAGGGDAAPEPEDSNPVAEKNLQFPHLDQYTVDLTAQARAGKIDPVLGRDSEIRQLIDILLRRRQNNPILTGEAGVGKTAVVEGFALRIAADEVPPALRDVDLRSLDLALLQAGASMKGEFENRLKKLIDEVRSSPRPIILFIDEAHTLIGAGGQAGQNDAANLLKPALARGELRCVAATTWAEYKRYFEKDAALSRRFQVVKVEEPDDQNCHGMLRGIASTLERHHGVRILDQALEAAVTLSRRYMPSRQLPDKAVSVLDTACARVALSRSALPPPLEDLARRKTALARSREALEREHAVDGAQDAALSALSLQFDAVSAEEAALSARWEKEHALVDQALALRGEIEIDPDNHSSRERLAAIQADLDALQGEQPLARLCVDREAVGQVISAWTGIPLGSMVRNEASVVLELASRLSRRVIGQDHALEAIAQRIQTSKANLDDPRRPIGVFLLIGPSGVGKTETALALADLLYGGEQTLITVNMSEFQEAHTVSSLKGSPPGYVGYGEGGVLTEAVRRRPYSVVLLDEVEKAHPDVLELFYQVFDAGRMEDGEGRQVDFRNTVIILTSNAAIEKLTQLCSDPDTIPSPPALVKAIKPELDRIFKPAFLGRTTIVPYYPIGGENLRRIIVLKLDRVQRRIQENHNLPFHYDPALVDAVAARCTESESGARNVDHVLNATLLPTMSRLLLQALAEGRQVSGFRATSDPQGNPSVTLSEGDPTWATV